MAREMAPSPAMPGRGLKRGSDAMGSWHSVGGRLTYAGWCDACRSASCRDLAATASEGDANRIALSADAAQHPPRGEESWRGFARRCIAANADKRASWSAGDAAAVAVAQLEAWPAMAAAGSRAVGVGTRRERANSGNGDHQPQAGGITTQPTRLRGRGQCRGRAALMWSAMGSQLLAPPVLLADLRLLLRREVVLDVEGAPDLLGRLACRGVARSE